MEAPDRPHVPEGCEDKTIAASGGQGRAVGTVAPTPTMIKENSGTKRRGGEVAGGEWAALHE